MASSAGLFADFRREEEDRQEPSQGTMGLFLWLLLAVITIPIIHAETLNRPHRSRVVTERPFRRVLMSRISTQPICEPCLFATVREAIREG